MTKHQIPNKYKGPNDPLAPRRKSFQRVGMKKIALSITIGVIAVLILVGVQRHFQQGRFSYVNFQRIQSGMTLPEVEALLGSPSSTEGGSPDGTRELVWYHHYDIWIESALLEIHVRFKEGKVIEARYHEPPFVL